MISVNLVNWRSRRILVLNRRFAAMNGVAILIWLGIAGLIYLMINSQINLAKSDVDYIDAQLKQETSALAEIKDLQTQKDLLLSRRATIEGLQASQPLIVEIFDNIARIMPAGVVLTQIVRKGDDLVLSGTGDSNYNISLLMVNAQKLSWVKSAKLGELKNNEGGTTVNKSVTVSAQPSQVTFELHLTMASTKPAEIPAAVAETPAAAAPGEKNAAP